MVNWISSCFVSISIEMPPHDVRVGKPVLPMRNLHVENIDIGIHFSSPSLSPPRDKANSRLEPAIAALVHAPAGPEPVPVNQPTPVESPTPEALQAFKAHWESQGRQLTYQEWLDFMQYWSMFGGYGQASRVPNLVSPSVPVVSGGKT